MGNCETALSQMASHLRFIRVYEKPTGPPDVRPVDSPRYNVRLYAAPGGDYRASGLSQDGSARKQGPLGGTPVCRFTAHGCGPSAYGTAQPYAHSYSACP